MERILFPKDTKIYRSFNDDTKREGYWFSLNEVDTHGYGKITAEFVPTRDLKLINISNSNFYDLLKQLIKGVTVTNDKLKEDSHNLLFPLGFDDVVFYRELAESYGVDHRSYKLNPYVHMESLLNFNNRSRLSLHTLDTKFMKFLKPLLSSFSDGIISLKPFPDIIRNGMQFPELSVFDKSVIEYVQDKPRGTAAVGGGSLRLPPLKLENEALRNAAEGVENIVKYITENNIKADLSNIKITETPYVESFRHADRSKKRKTRKLRR
jgi:hypothetical protein